MTPRRKSATPADAGLLALWADIQASTKAWDNDPRQQTSARAAQYDTVREELSVLWRSIDAKRERLAAMVPETPAGALALLALLGIYEEWDALITPDNFERPESAIVRRSLVAGLERMAGKGGAA